MAVFKKSEFAEQCGLSRAHISMAIKRGKIVVSDDGTIDSSNPVNEAFRVNCEHKSSQKAEQPEKEVKREKATTKQSKPEKKKPDPKLKKALENKFNVEIAEREVRTKKISSEVELIEMQKMKLSGKLIPTDLVMNTIRQLMHSIMTSFNDGAEALVTDIGKKLKMDRSDIATMRKSLKSIVNESVNRSIDDAQKNIDNIISEHSQVKRMK